MSKSAMQTLKEAEMLVMREGKKAYDRALAMVEPFGPEYVTAFQGGMGELTSVEAQSGLNSGLSEDSGADYDSYDYDDEDAPSPSEVQAGLAAAERQSMLVRMLRHKKRGR